MTTLQDSQGFVWLGTEDGLVRFDGHELYRYAYSRTDASSLPGQFHLADRRGRAPRSVDRDEGRRPGALESRHRHLHRLSPRLRKTRTRSRATACAPCSSIARGRIWVGTSDAGVDMLDPATGRIEHLRHDPRNAGSLEQRPRLHAGARSRPATSGSARTAGSIAGSTRSSARAFRRRSRVAARPADLAGARRPERRALGRHASTRGLVRLDATAACSSTFRHDARRGDSLGSDDVRALLEDQAGHLWVGTADGPRSARPRHWRVHPLPARGGRRGLAARLVRHVAVSGRRRARVDRHAQPAA